METKNKQIAANAPMDELKEENLYHYEALATQAGHWSSAIPCSIKFYFDYRKMNIIKRIILAFKIKREQ